MSSSIWNRGRRPAPRPGRRRRSLALERLEGRALLANSAPSGTDTVISLLEDGSHSFVEGDFGFADPNDSPPNVLSAVIITSLPTAGTLKIAGVDVVADQSIPTASLGSLVYAPAANASGTPYATFGFKVQDDGGGADTSVSPNTITVNVTAVNDAPVRTSPGSLAPVSVDEDAANPPSPAVSLGLELLSYAPGGGTDEASQTLTYRVTVIPSFITIWKGTGPQTGTQVLQGASVLLDELRGLKYRTVPNANGRAPASLTWTVTDDGGTANGGTATLTESLSINVNPVNDAPSAVGGAVLSAINEDETSPAGETVANLFGANFNDQTDAVTGGSAADTLLGVVLTGNAATPAQGTWEWLGTGSARWDAVTTPSDSAGLYLTAATKVRFRPTADFNGSPGKLTVRLVDSSATGLVLGATVDVSTGKRGGSTPFSDATVDLSTSVTAVNDAPVGSGSATLAAVDQNATTPPGDTVANLFGGNFSDAKDSVPWGSTANVLLGVVVTANAATAAEGTWQWQNGATWTNISTSLSDTSGLYLTAATNVRFLPATNYNGTPGSLTVRLVDSSSTGLTNGGTVNVSINGDTSAYSSGTVALGTSVTAVPAAPSDLKLDSGSDSGSSNSDRNTNEPFPTFKGKAEASVTVEVFAGNTSLGTCKADGAGDWSFNMKNPAAGTNLAAPTFFKTDGTYAITARAVNDAGKAGPASSQILVTIDTTPPAAPGTPVLDPSSDTGTPGDNSTTNDTPFLTVTAPSDAVSVKIVLVNLAATPSTVTLVATRVPNTNTWSARPATPLATGVWTVTATATDLADNTSASSLPALSLTIVPAPATPNKPDLMAADDKGVSDTDDVTNVRTPTFTVTAPVGTKQVELFVDGTSVGTATVGTDGTTWSKKLDQPLLDGQHSVTAAVTDANANVSPQSAALVVTIDTVSPTVQSFGSATPSPRKTPVASIDSAFSEPVFGVTPAAFRLLYNSTLTVNLVGTATTTPKTPVTAVGTQQGSAGWTIGSLDKANAATGSYALSLNPSGLAAVTDRAGNPLLASSQKATWTIDVTAPTVTAWTLAPAAATQPRNTAVTSARVQFSEAVTGVALSDFELTRDGTVVPLTGASVTGAGNSWTLASIPSTGSEGTYILRLKASGSGITDAVGNVFAFDASTAWQMDTMPPTGSFEPVTTPRGTALQSIGLSFAEPVTGVELGDFSLTRNGSTVPLTGVGLTPSSGPPSLSPATAYVLTGLGTLTGVDGVYVLTLSRSSGAPVRDAATNPLAADVTRTWTVDTAVPKVVSFTLAPVDADGVRNASGTVTGATVTFDRTVTGVDLADFRLTRDGTEVPLAPTASLTGAGTTWTLGNLGTLTSGDGSYVLTLVAAGSDIKRAVAPENPLAANAVAAWKMDTVAPTVGLSVVGRVTAVGSTKFTVQALFSEAVTGFALGDVTVSAGGTASNLVPVTGSGDRAYRFDVAVAPSPRDPVTVSIAANKADDTAGNGNTASATLSLVTDLVGPIVTLTGPALTKASPFTVRATFNEDVTGFDSTDVTVANGTATTVTPVAGSKRLYDITISAAADGVASVSIGANRATDASGNGNSPSNSLSVRVDRTAPTVQLASLSGTVSRNAVLQFLATFKEPVTGVDTLDLDVTNGTVASVQGSGTTWTFAVKPAADGAVTARVKAGGASDVAGNGNVVSNQVTVRSDRNPPTATVSAPNAGIVTITFSEPVTGFNLPDLKLTRNGAAVTLPAGSLTNPSGDRTTWRINLGTAISLPGAYVLRLVSFNSGIADDAGNLLVADASATFTVDTTPPMAVISGIPPVTRTVIDAATVAFSELVTGFDLADLELRRNGAVVPLTTPPLTIAPLTGPAATYRITGLTAFTDAEGSYTLLLRAANSKIADSSGNLLMTDARATWIVDLTAPAVMSLGPASQATSASPATSVPITFTEPVTGLDVSDFTLRRDGVAVQLVGAKVAPVDASGRAYLLSELSPLTGLRGDYSLTLRAGGTGVVDAAGNPLAADGSTAWTNVGTALPGTVTAAFVPVSPSPRFDPVAGVTVTFSAPVVGVDAGDFVLTRTVAGTPTPLTGFTVTGTGGGRTIGGLADLTALPGAYELRLQAAGSGIATTGGLGLARDAVTTWTTLATTAEPPTATVIADAAAASGTIDAVTIEFSKPVTGVTLSTLRLSRDGVPLGLTNAVLTGSGALYRLRGLAPISSLAGDYLLTLRGPGSGIRSTDGAALAVDTTTAWTVADTTLRAAFLAVDPVRTSPLAAVGLRFSGLVKGVDLADLELERDGEVVPLYGVSVTGSGSTWTVGNLAPVQGVRGFYTLRLRTKNADIMTGDGLTLAENAEVSWTIV